MDEPLSRNVLQTVASHGSLAQIVTFHDRPLDCAHFVDILFLLITVWHSSIQASNSTSPHANAFVRTGV